MKTVQILGSSLKESMGHKAVTINAKDYDPKKHTLWQDAEKQPEPAKEPEPEAPKRGRPRKRSS